MKNTIIKKDDDGIENEYNFDQWSIDPTEHGFNENDYFEFSDDEEQNLGIEMQQANESKWLESAKLEKEQYLRRPRSVRVDSEFRLWIPDFESYRIQVYKKDFVELDKTQFTAPTRNPTLDVT